MASESASGHVPESVEPPKWGRVCACAYVPWISIILPMKYICILAHICVCIHTYVEYMYFHVYIHICTHIYLYRCTHTHIYVLLQVGLAIKQQARLGP